MILGIDLGTTYSAAAYLNDDSEPVIASNYEGSHTTPSIVFFDSNNAVIVGEIAKENSIMNPSSVVFDVKNNMGKNKTYHVNGRNYTPSMISSFILRKLIQDTEKVSGQSVDGIVVTVPAYFKDSQRSATEEAAQLADVPLIGMINEPTAAALCYIRKNRLKNERILVYDLGGGTFDVTILNINEHQDVSVISTDGISGTGGRFFDEKIVDYVVSFILQKYNIDLEDDEYLDVFQELLLKAEKAKIQLSSRTETTLVLNSASFRESIPLTREQFESMISNMIDKTEWKVQAALQSGNLAPEDIDRVLLVGGSSRIPYVLECLTRFFGKAPVADINPDEAVAMGAALYSLQKHNGTGPRFSDVCSHSIGLVYYNDKGQEENDILIPKNAKLPVAVKQAYATMVNGQKSLELKVTEGEFREVTDVDLIGVFHLELPENLPARSKIDVEITLDPFQMIHIVLIIPDHMFRKEYSIQRKNNLGEGELREMTGMLKIMTVS